MSTDIEYIRLLIADQDAEMFGDHQLQMFLDRENGPLRAAAQALDTIASNEVLLSKKISSQDLSTDGPAVAAELRARAAALRKQADDQKIEDSGWAVRTVIMEPGKGIGRPELVEFPW